MVEAGASATTEDSSMVEAGASATTEDSQKELQLVALAVDLSPVGKLAVNSRGEIVLVNREIERMFGYARHELLGRPIEMLLPLRFREKHPALRAHYFESPSPRRMGTGRELYGLRKDGSEVPVEVRLSALSTAEGLYVMNSVVDLTARRESEQRMRQAQKMEAIGTLVSGIAHDFNNILLGIIGHAELLARQNELSPRGHEDVQQVLRSANRGRELVKRILTFSRHSDVSRAPLSPVGVIADTLGLLRASLPATVTIRDWSDPATPPVLSQETLLSQIVMNLTTNAAQAMANGGVVEVETGPFRVDEARHVTAGQLLPGLYCRIRVRDTGSGIDPAILPRVFEPFFTTKGSDKGTGLGLSVVLGIVEVHAGAIELCTSPSGTVVSVYLPTCEFLDASIRPGPHIPRVLVVDDEPNLVSMMARAISLFGFATTEFASSLQALEAFNARPDGFDLIVTDNNMPHLTGVEMARKIRELRPDIPILLLTGLPDRKGMSDAEVTRVLSKPFTVTELHDVLVDVLGKLPAHS